MFTSQTGGVATTFSLQQEITQPAGLAIPARRSDETHEALSITGGGDREGVAAPT